MFILRTAFWLTLVVFLLPSDKDSQERMALAASNVFRQVSTACDRHAEACQQGAIAWGVLKAKAQVAGRTVFDIAMDRLAPRGEQAVPVPVPVQATVEPAVEARPALKSAPAGRQQQHGTLRVEDIAPRWRGDQSAGRL